MASQTVAAAFFCPQNRPPKAPYLKQIRSYLRTCPSLAAFALAIADLPETWKLYANARPDIRALEQGAVYTGYFRKWIMDDDDESVAQIMSTMSGIIALPLLTILQVVQYFQYLEARAISHNDFIQETKVGGLQGFCGGQLPVFAIASSQSEVEVAKNAVQCLRIALGIGAFGELGDDPNVEGTTTLAVRLKYAEQANEIVALFPGIYVSAVTEPLSVSFVGSTLGLRELKAHLEAQELLATELFLRGKVHNPENQTLWQDMCELIDRTPELQLPSGAALRVPVRHNSSGKLMGPDVNLAHELTRSTLVARCEWFDVLLATAAALADATPSHAGTQYTFAMFGTGNKNIVTPVPFEEKGLRIAKQDVVKFVDEWRSGQAHGPYRLSAPELTSFPAHSIAIVGAACRLPGADSLDELWDNILSHGAINAKPISADLLDASRVPRNMPSLQEGRTWFGNFLDDVDSFDNAFFGVSPREALNMDPQQRHLLEVAYQALDSSGYLRHHQRENFDRVGCFVGSTYTEYLENTTAYNATAYTATGTIRAMQSGKISYHFGWSGPSEVIDTACSSSLVAVNRACRAIQAGECNMALAGGVNIITGLQNFLDLGKAGFLSHTGQCKPFDASADGYCRADGVGLVVLKSLEQALRDNDEVLGVIRGIATNHGGLSSSITVPHDRAQVELFKTVLGQSGLSKQQISYIEAHGTGTQVGDPIEMSSIRHVFAGADRQMLHVGSLKANVGHSESAAGIGSLIKVITMLQRSSLPPLAGFKTLNPKIPDLTPDNIVIDSTAMPWIAPLKAALVNSYGASGSNSALLCSEAPRRAYPSSYSSPALRYPVCISAVDATSLQAFASKLSDHISQTPGLRLDDVAYTLNERRKRHNTCWTGVYYSKDKLIEDLKSVSGSTFDTTERKARKNIIMVFSGQSKQTIGLDTSVYCSMPAFRGHLEQCDKILTSQGFASILPTLSQHEPVEDVVALQCGTFAVQYASAKCWLQAGVQVQAMIGHSFGELTALVVSGILTLEDGLKLVATRATLMKTKWGPERGTMLAIQADRKIVQELVSLTAGLEIACFNGAKSQVVVGTKAAIALAQKTLDEDTRFSGREIRRQLVKTSHGFHSTFTEPMLEDIAQLAESLDFRPAQIPLETCTASACAEVTWKRIAQHTREAVYFEEAISRLEERLGSCVFLEAGFGSPIIPMTKRAVGDPSKHTFIAGPTESDQMSGLADMTTSLWKESIPVTFWHHLNHAELEAMPVWLPPYQFRRSKHWLAYANYGDSGTLQDKTAFTHAALTQLVTTRGRSHDSWASLTFTIHAGTKRFTDVVSGHAVRGQPLCPASMYLECAVMAAMMIDPGLTIGAIRCDDISFQGGLGLSPDRDVVLGMDGAGEYLSWDFTVKSTLKQHVEARPTTHAKGRLSITSAKDWQLYSRVIAEQARSLRDNPAADKMTAARAYMLFSRVVSYSDVMRGIQQVFMHKNHAVADVTRPSVPARDSHESTAVQSCDAIALDTFIQVAGLLVNSSEACPPDEVYIATKIDNLSVQGCNFTQHDGQYVVYTTTNVIDSTRTSCDVFVLDKSGALIVTVAGVQFTRMPVARLEKILQHAQINVAHTVQQTRTAHMATTKHDVRDFDGTTITADTIPRDTVDILRSQQSRGLGLDSISALRLAKQAKTDVIEITEAPSLSSSASSTPPDRATVKASSGDARLRQRVIELISENTGSSLANIEDSNALQDIGIDSLSIVELKSSLEEAFGLHLGPHDMMLESTLKEILDLGGRRVGHMKTSDGPHAAIHVASTVITAH